MKCYNSFTQGLKRKYNIPHKVALDFETFGASFFFKETVRGDLVFLEV